MNRGFSSLSPQEALYLAISVEARNGGLYRQFADLFGGFGDRDSLEMAAVFLDLSDQERRHGSVLQQRYLERYGDDDCAITEEDVRPLLEVPRLSDGSLFAIARSGASAAPQGHVLEVALAAEKSSLRFYSYLLQYTDDPDLRSLYGELGEFEEAHVNILQRCIAGLHRSLSPEA
jgi:rubrerythrin